MWRGGRSGFFGSSVSIDGDTLAVGSVFWGSTRGAVYLFTRTQGVWSEQANIKGPNTGIYFGDVVDIFGDTLVVGAPLDDSGATGINGDESDNSENDSGAVYVYVRTEDIWTQEAYIKASNTNTYNHFGRSLAYQNNQLIVGARFEGSPSTGIDCDESQTITQSVAAYLFIREEGVWRQQHYIKASNAEQQDTFGGSLALDGQMIAVGAQGEDGQATGVDGDQGNNDASGSGAVYIFSGQ